MMASETPTGLRIKVSGRGSKDKGCADRGQGLDLGAWPLSLTSCVTNKPGACSPVCKRGVIILLSPQVANTKADVSVLRSQAAKTPTGVLAFVCCSLCTSHPSSTTDHHVDEVGQRTCPHQSIGKSHRGHRIQDPATARPLTPPNTQEEKCYQWNTIHYKMQPHFRDFKM